MYTFLTNIFPVCHHPSVKQLAAGRRQPAAIGFIKLRFQVSGVRCQEKETEKLKPEH
jgi:hypothetical protein